MKNPNYLTVEELCEDLVICQATLYAWPLIVSPSSTVSLIVESKDSNIPKESCAEKPVAACMQSTISALAIY